MSGEYTTHEVTTVVKEYRIPVPGFWTEIEKALAAIRKELGPDRSFYTDSVSLDVGDDCVILRYEKSRTST